MSCGGCNAPCGSIHKCSTCGVNMHPFCGTPIGEQGFGQQVMCPKCSADDDVLVQIDRFS